MEIGKLYYLTVPIGNLKDISINVLEAFKVGEYFFVEDTRSFKNLLNLYDIPLDKKKIRSYHDQSSDSVAVSIDELLKEERIFTIALRREALSLVTLVLV